MTGTRTLARVLVPLLLLASFSAAPATGATSGGWSNLASAGAGTGALNGPVLTMLRKGTKLYVGGNFTNAGGVGAADYLAVWNGKKWSAVGAGLTAQVESIAVDGSDVYVGGPFLNASANPNADHLARWTGTQWAAVGGATFNASVAALQVTGGFLYAGGSFTDADGIAAADGIARFDLAGATGWSAITTGAQPISGIRTFDVDGSTLFVGGSFQNGAGVAAADSLATYDTTSGDWGALGAANFDATVNDVTADGGGLYVAGDFINAAGIGAADKVAYWNGAAWEALGGGGGSFGEASSDHANTIVVDDGVVFVGGYFLNLGGKAKADMIAALRGGTWVNVGSRSGGADGPGWTPFYALAVLGNDLIAGGQQTDIGDGVLNDYIASFLLRQPDGTIKVGTGKTVGGNVYNTTGAKQSVVVKVASGGSKSCTIKIQNDGFVTDSIKVKGPGSGSGFTLTYLRGSTKVTSQVVAGSLTLNLAPGDTATLTLRIKVAGSVGAGATKAVLVKATSTGGGKPVDAVKAQVKVT